MGLLTIQEPEADLSESLISVKPKVALGIDLGTTHSLVGAYINNQTVLFKDSNGKTLLPSVVLYTADNQQILVGHQATDSPEAIFSAKRFMGKALSELNHIPMQSARALQADQDNLAVLSTPQGIKSPIQISAEILKKLLKIAQSNLAVIYPEYELSGAVITVPAYFDDGQRQATKAAAELVACR